MLLPLKLDIAGALWTPLYTFTLEALALEKTDVLSSQVRDLQDATEALEASCRHEAHYWRADLVPSSTSGTVPMVLTEKMTSDSDVFVVDGPAPHQLRVYHTGVFQVKLQLTHGNAASYCVSTVVQVKEGDVFQVTVNANTTPAGSLLLMEV